MARDAIDLRQHSVSPRRREGTLTSTLTAIGAHKVEPRTTNHQIPKKIVTPRDFPYTARTRMKKRRLLTFTARITKADIVFISAWQLLTGATAVGFS